MQFDIECIEKHAEIVSSSVDDLTLLFYSELFTAHPELKSLFEHVDLVRQRRKLGATLTLIVNNLRHHDVLVSVLRSLGSMHSRRCHGQGTTRGTDHVPPGRGGAGSART